MGGRFGHAWSSQYGDDPQGIAGQAWNADLDGLTRPQINAGFEALKLEPSEFPPSSTRFRAMCLGVPTFAAVNSELLTTENANRTPFARLVWQHIDGYAHRHASARDAKRMREEAYSRAAEHVLAGGALPTEVAGALEHETELIPSGIPKSREGRVQRLREVLGDEFRERAANRRERV